MSKPIEEPFLNVTTKLLVTNTSKKLAKELQSPHRGVTTVPIV
jgi:hypothetical protein